MAGASNIQCKECGNGEFVTIGLSQYCTECGMPAAISHAQNSKRKAAKPIAKTVTGPRTKAAHGLHARHSRPSAGTLDLRSKAAKEGSEPASRISRFPKRPGTLDLRAKPQAAAAKPAPKQKQQLATEVSQPVLPTAVSAQIDAMAAKALERHSTPAKPKRARSHILTNAITAASTPQPIRTRTVVAIGAILVAMAGFVWFQNSPKLAFHNAALQAGLEASLPNYLPASYGAVGKPAVAPGEITLTYNAPGAPKPLKITERRTDWDSNSLRDNYVSQQTDNYLSIPGQGLTIYTFNGGTATWVNHGVWYLVEGANTLGRDQLLKIAYGL